MTIRACEVGFGNELQLAQYGVEHPCGQLPEQCLRRGMQQFSQANTSKLRKLQRAPARAVSGACRTVCQDATKNVKFIGC